MFGALVIAIVMLSDLCISHARIEGPTIKITHQLGIPENYYYDDTFQKIGSKYYYISTDHNVHWYEALHICRSAGGHLISLTDNETLHAISQYAKNTSFWLDLSDLGQEGEFVSMSSGLKPNFTKWCNHHKVFNSDENCVNIEYSASSEPCMKSLSCFNHRKYICESNTPRTISITIL